MTTHRLLLAVAALIALAALPRAAAAEPPDFSGTWALNGPKSKNIGMMSELQMVCTVKQSPTELSMVNAVTMGERESKSEIRLDLTGKPVENQNPMESLAQTVSHWEGDKLVTVWTSQASVAGKSSVRTEVRSLSPDGKTLTVDSHRSKGSSVIMVYDKK